MIVEEITGTEEVTDNKLFMDDLVKNVQKAVQESGLFPKAKISKKKALKIVEALDPHLFIQLTAKKRELEHQPTAMDMISLSIPKVGKYGFKERVEPEFVWSFQQGCLVPNKNFNLGGEPIFRPEYSCLRSHRFHADTKLPPIELCNEEGE